MAENWKGDMDLVLIVPLQLELGDVLQFINLFPTYFVGCSILRPTAFIIESCSNHSSDDTVLLLAQISQQQTSLSNSPSFSDGLTSRITGSYQPIFPPSTSAIVCNILWFLSLGFSLACALSATLVEQWIRHYIQACNSKPTLQDRAEISI